MIKRVVNFAGSFLLGKYSFLSVLFLLIIVMVLVTSVGCCSFGPVKYWGETELSYSTRYCTVKNKGTKGCEGYLRLHQHILAVDKCREYMKNEPGIFKDFDYCLKTLE